MDRGALKAKKIVASIEARMTSSRLPGKVLKPVLGEPFLKVLVERLKRSRYLDAIVIATTINPTDEPIARLARQLGVSVFRGSEEDVLGRVVGAVESVGGDIIVEITGDCPLMDPRVVDHVLENYIRDFPKYDYVCNTGAGDKSLREIPIGMDVQVFSFNDLKKIAAVTKDPEDREHVSLYFYRTGKARYSIKNVSIPSEWKREYPVRLTLDAPEDYQFLQTIYERLVERSAYFTLEDILTLCDQAPDILRINSLVVQRRPTGI